MLSTGLLLAIIAVVVTVCDAQYRCDYHYDTRTNRHYKYHEIPATWQEAQLRCYLEGAVLASPLNNLILETMSELMLNYSRINNSTDRRVLIGAAAKLSKGDFLTIEGVPINQLAAKWDGNSEPAIYEEDDNSVGMCSNGLISIKSANNRLPYICYKENLLLTKHNEHCGTIDPDYSLHSTGSCYKFHRVPRIWSSAHMACEAEGGYLTVVNSKEEADILKGIFAKNPASSMHGAFEKSNAHIGFLDYDEHGTWRTIQGESLTEAGFATWNAGQPNNYTTHGVGQYCGSLVRSTGLLNDYSCTSVLPFICEKDPLVLVTKGCATPL